MEEVVSLEVSLLENLHPKYFLLSCVWDHMIGLTLIRMQSNVWKLEKKVGYLIKHYCSYTNTINTDF
jgi:hypothetical protein